MAAKSQLNNKLHTNCSSAILSKVSAQDNVKSIKSDKLSVKPIILPKPQKNSSSFVFKYSESHPDVLKKSSLPNNSSTPSSSFPLDHRNSLPSSPIHDRQDESSSSPPSLLSTPPSPTTSLLTLPNKPTSFLHSMQTNFMYANQTKLNNNSSFSPSIKPKPPVPFKPAKLREQLLHSLASESLANNKVVTSSINSCSSSQPDSRELSSPCESINEKISSFHQEFVNNYQPPSNGLLRAPKSSSGTLNTSTERTCKRQSSSLSSSFLYKYLSTETPQSSEEEPDQLSLSSSSSNTVSEVKNVGDKSQPIDPPAVPKKAKDPFDVAKEIAHTEASFVDDLQILVDLGELMQSFFTSDVIKSVICHVPELMSVHRLLRDNLRERIEEWRKKPQICDILLETGPYLKVHNFYAKDFSKIHENLAKATKNSGFAKALKEFQKERCRQLCVRDFMHKAVKRLPEIKLLLDRYKKYLPPDHVDRKNCLKALKLFSEINESAEALICQADSTYVLIGIQSSMVKGSEDIVKPGRILLKVGELMKISRRHEQPRKFVLCSDCLIYLTQHQLGSYRLNHELSLETMVVTPNPQFETEFNIISKTRSIPVRAASVEERQQWIDAIQKAINEYQSSRGSIRKSLVTGQLGDTAPIWVPDNRVTMCQDCCNEFTISFRRHHCRACGRVVCSDCSSNQAPLKYLNYKPNRVCDKCFAILQKNFSQMEKLSVPTIQKASSSELSIDLSPENSASTADSIDQEPDLDQLKNGFVRMPLRASHRRREKPTRLMISADDKGCSMSGYLSFKENDQKKWKKGWFVIKENVIYRFKQSNDTAALESLAILGYHVEIVPDKKVINLSERGHLFQLSHPGQSTMTFKADSVELAKKWTEEMLKNTRILL